MNAEDRVRAELVDAGCDGWCWAHEVGSPGHGVGADPDSPVVVASMYKLFVMVAVCRAIAAGALDPRARVTLRPGTRTPGPTGFALFADEVEVSVRDLVRTMVTVSDNTSAQALHDLLPADSLDEAVAALGVEQTVIRGSASDENDLLVRELGAHDFEDAAHLLATDPDATQLHVYDPAYVSHSTPRSLCLVMDRIWTDTAADRTGCAFMREVLGQQIWPHRIASGFDPGTTLVSGKTGTIGRIRAETAVVEHDGEPPIAVSVVTRAARADASLPLVDSAIGRIARTLVDAIRMGDHLAR